MTTSHRRVETINSSFAAKHPPHPLRQRGRSEVQVNKYLSLLKDGKFLQGGDVPGIYLDADGFCIDGQHRLEAIARSGKEISLPVYYNADIERVATFVDSNRKRTVVDRAAMLGRKDYDRAEHTVTSYCYADSSGMRANSVQSANFTEDAQVWLDRFDTIKDFLFELSAVFDKRTSSMLKRGQPGVPVVMGVLCRAYLAGADESELIEFFNIYIKGGLGSEHVSARFPTFLRELTLEHNNGISGSDVFRKALFFVAQAAIFDFIGRSKKSSKYRLPLIAVDTSSGLSTVGLDARRALNLFLI